MKKLFIEGKEDSPEIILDKENNRFVITGRSLPEDAFTFYYPVHLWMDEYVNNPNQSTSFIFNLEYFNSTSVKQLFDILIKLEKIKDQGKEVDVIWYYNEMDELMEDKGKEIKNLINLSFELRTI